MRQGASLRQTEAGRGLARPTASTRTVVVTFRDANWVCACAGDVTRSLTRVYARKFYYDARLNSIRFCH